MDDALENNKWIANEEKVAERVLKRTIKEAWKNKILKKMKIKAERAIAAVAIESYTR